MKVKITDGIDTQKEIEIKDGNISGKDLLEKLNIPLFEATIVKNGVIVRESEILNSNDEIKILKMIHGG